MRHKSNLYMSQIQEFQTPLPPGIWHFRFLFFKIPTIKALKGFLRGQMPIPWNSKIKTGSQKSDKLLSIYNFYFFCSSGQ